MTKYDEDILASVGMTMDEADAISSACEAGDLSMWDSSKVSLERPLEMVVAERPAAGETSVCVSEFLSDALWLPDDLHDGCRP